MAEVLVAAGIPDQLPRPVPLHETNPPERQTGGTQYHYPPAETGGHSPQRFKIRTADLSGGHNLPAQQGPVEPNGRLEVGDSDRRHRYG